MAEIQISPQERKVIRTIRDNGDHLGPTELIAKTGLNNAVRLADGLVDRDVLRVQGGEYRTADPARRAV